MITGPDVSADGGDKEVSCISPPCLTAVIPFLFYNLSLFLVYKEDFPLAGTAHCLVVVFLKDKENPTAQADGSFLFPQQIYTTARCRLPVEIRVCSK